MMKECITRCLLPTVLLSMVFLVGCAGGPESLSEGPIQVGEWTLDIKRYPYSERTVFFVNGQKVADDFWPFYRSEYTLKGFSGSTPVEAQCFHMEYLFGDDYMTCNLFVDNRRLAVVRR